MQFQCKEPIVRARVPHYSRTTITTTLTPPSNHRDLEQGIGIHPLVDGCSPPPAHTSIHVLLHLHLLP